MAIQSESDSSLTRSEENNPIWVWGLFDSNFDFMIRVRVRDGPELDLIKNPKLLPDSNSKGNPTLNDFYPNILFPLKL